MVRRRVAPPAPLTQVLGAFKARANLRGSTVIPEPGMLALVGIGLLGFGAASRRRKV